MTIQVGDKIPIVTLRTMRDNEIVTIGTDELFSANTTALFSVPGAFTPTCSAKHLPSFITAANALNEKGIDQIACVSVNDVFVMHAWGLSQQVENKVVMLADGNAEFALSLGLELDATGYGMGVRCQRFSMLIADGIVKILNIESAGEYRVSSAEYLLEHL